jgi:asparagine synthase (glutamine-hydrolysing)
MSAICGIFRLDGRPITSDELEKQMAALQHCGPDGHGTWISGNVGLGHQMLHITPESIGEELPASLGEGPRLVITCDARLDNRDELFGLLGIPAGEQAAIADSRLVLAAYDKWGTDCPAHLLGDFALAIWDAREHRLFCARDHMGIVPFYYHHSGSLFVFSSDVLGVVALPEVPRDLNDLAVARHLEEGALYSNTMTLLSAVQKLPPAHWMSASQKGIQIERYWSPRDAPRVRYPSLEQYVEALRGLLQQAVECRLRTSFPVGSHLSGGLDSSSIAVLAARILRSRGQVLSTYSWQHPLEAGEEPSAPEWAYTQMVCEQEGLLCEHSAFSGQAMLEFLRQDISQHSSFDAIYERLVCQAARYRGIRVMLSGWGGDELISFNGRGYYAELFWHARWIKLIKGLRVRRKLDPNSQSFVQEIKSWLWLLDKLILTPSLPDKLHALTERQTTSRVYTVPTFAKYIRQHRRPLPDVPRSRVGLHANQLALLEYGHLSLRMESWAHCGSYYGITYAFPLMDKRIIEFSLGIPSDMYLQAGLDRYLFRASLKGILPAELLRLKKPREPRRAARWLAVVTEAAQLWFHQANEPDWLEGKSRYIDIRALDQFNSKTGLTEEERIQIAGICMNSIQVLVAERSSGSILNEVEQTSPQY